MNNDNKEFRKEEKINDWKLFEGNGYYPRDFVTKFGKLELEVSRRGSLDHVC